MKSDKNILIAFILNFLFSIFELVGGIFTNSISIISDAIHDFGDALSIGISFILEKVSKRKPNDKYTYGYARYSILGGLITTIVLIIGSVFVVFSSVNRILNPELINYNGMIVFAIFGVLINFIAAYFTKDGHSINQRAVNLHMLEDVFGWLVVLIGSILMKYTNILAIDSIMSIGIAAFILLHAVRNLKEILDLFLEKVPTNISLEEVKRHILQINGIKDIHHIHVWSIDGVTNYATMHIVTEEKNIKELKQKVKEEMQEFDISHTTIEIESSVDECSEIECKNEKNENLHHKHHH